MPKRAMLPARGRKATEFAWAAKVRDHAQGQKRSREPMGLSHLARAKYGATQEVGWLFEGGVECEGWLAAESGFGEVTDCEGCDVAVLL